MTSPFKTSRNDYAENPRTITFWEVCDTMSRWQDGTSNQLIFGEKAMGLDKLGECEATADSGGTNVRDDCSYLSATGDGAHNVHYFRTFEGTGTAMSPNNYDRSSRGIDRMSPGSSDLRVASFGSWHPGVCNFAMGDGAVKAVSATTPGRTMLLLSQVDDGQAVSLP